MTTQTNIQTKIVDRPAVSESFADSVLGCWFDGHTWRVDFSVTRIDQPMTEPATSSQYPSCRLVLSLPAGLALLERLSDLLRQLEANGTIKRTPVPTAPNPTVTH